jgi:hypothetical protein
MSVGFAVLFINNMRHFFFFFWWDWGLSLELSTYKADAYFLNHISNPFFSGYFADGSWELFAQAGLKQQSS